MATQRKPSKSGINVCVRTPAGTEICIRDPRYDQRSRRAKWNVDPTPLMARDAQAARQAFPQLSKADHEALAQGYAASARNMDTSHNKAVAAAMKRHGFKSFGGHGKQDPGPLISGVVSDKFSETEKNRLRKLAHTATRLRDASVLHWAGAGKRTPWHKAFGRP